MASYGLANRNRPRVRPIAVVNSWFGSIRSGAKGDMWDAGNGPGGLWQPLNPRNRWLASQFSGTACDYLRSKDANFLMFTMIKLCDNRCQPFAEVIGRYFAPELSRRRAEFAAFTLRQWRAGRDLVQNG